MAESTGTRFNFKNFDFKNSTNAAVAVIVVVVVLLIILPLPTPILDFLMACNLLLSVLILLTTLFVSKSVDFSTFPTILLVSTVFGLALNVASTRLILGDGANFNGKMVTAFGTFVVGGAEDRTGIIIGLIIFIILIVVQVAVITKGATRIAEVQARFTLDAMPNKMMAIDAEFNAGTITDEEAKRRKVDLQSEVDFYSSMDGASKFISGSVKAGIFITVINLLGGIIIGKIKSEADVFATYTRFTVGDGLLSQVPSLLISVATGLIVTRSASDGKSTLGDDVKKDFTQNAIIYYIAGGTLIILGVLPGFPWYILIPMGALLNYFGWRLSKIKKKTESTKIEQEKKKSEKNSSPVSVSPVVPLDPLSLELGYGIIPLLDEEKGGDLKERIGRIRSELGLELGLVVPPIRMIDNINLEPSEYSFKIKGVPVGSAKVKMNWYMCMNTGGVTEEIPGEPTSDPAFGLPAIWITSENCEKAERAGYAVIDPPTIIATHLTEMIRKNASEILGRQEVKSILDELQKTYPAVVEEVNKKFEIGEIQKVLQGLLREQVSIRNMVAILETMSDYAAFTKTASILVEKVRQRLGKQICLQYADEQNRIHVLTVEPSFIQRLVQAPKYDTPSGPVAVLEPVEHRKWISSLSSYIVSMQDKGYVPVILCPEEARILIKTATQQEMPTLVVLSVPEIDKEIKLESLGEINVGL
ncbi:MAG: flagellar biosynthesis protein FlhA [Treponemataceae bacterium]